MNREPASHLSVEGLVHDLNNVFETIQEASELLGSDPQWRTIAATIQRSVDRGRRIVTSFCEPDERSFELGEVVESAFGFSRDYLRASHLPLPVFGHTIDRGLRILGAPADWERAFSNLLINSGQAMHQPGNIQVHAARSGADVLVTVADDGPGIDPAILPHIFEPHFSTKGNRSGLGLHVVESVVRRYGGTITAGRPEQGSGAIFEIRIPAA